MLSIDFVRNNKERVAEAAVQKNREVDVDLIIATDNKRRELIQKAQILREERNSLAKKKPTTQSIARGKQIKIELKSIENALTTTEEKLHSLLSYVPNVPLDDVPVGPDASGNVELYKKGSIPSFDFTPRSHIDLGLSLDLFDLERGAKVSGFRGYFLKNEGAVLQMAVLWYAFQKLVAKGYTPLIAPAIVKGFTFFGIGQFPWGEGEVYRMNEDDAFLAGTAEVPVTAYYSGEILNESELPHKFVAFSPCFRREAGAYGKDTKGLYRLHEFWKIEQVMIGKNDLEASRKLHKELQENTEEVLTDFGLSYRVLNMCTGDMGEPQIYKYDTEVWMPSRNDYGETASNSIMGDFQARRLNIRYRKSDGTITFCHTLNDTQVATPRILIALIENFQRKDGSIAIPKALHSLTGFTEITPKKTSAS